MPQLNLAWWLFNFTLGWITLLIVFTILLKTTISSNKTIIQSENTNAPVSSTWLWN